MQGERVFLRPIAEDDSELIVAWRNIPRVSDQMFALRGPTLEEHRLWFEHYRGRNDRCEFCICIIETGEAIGTIGLSGIDSYHRKAEYGILIGSQVHAGQGYAKEASQLILSYGFKTLGLQKISLRVFAGNEPALHLYRQVGFVEEGCLKKEYKKNGLFRDVILMAVFDGSESGED